MWKQNRVGDYTELRSHLGCTKQLSWMNSIPVDLQLLEEPIVQALLRKPALRKSLLPVAAKIACLA